MHELVCQDCGARFPAVSSRARFCASCVTDHRRYLGRHSGRPAVTHAMRRIARLHLGETPKSLFDWVAVFGTDDGFTPRPAHSPTESLPGSQQKVAILAQRLAAGEDLWHPMDARPRLDAS